MKMKEYIVLSMLLIVALSVVAQDVVVKKDGSTILVKVLEVNQDNIKYKKHSNPNGPTYIIDLDEVLSVNYENGEKDDFNLGSNEEKQKEHVYGLIEKTADYNNNTIIAQHNRIYQIKNDKGKQNALAKYCLIFLGAKSSSIMSNEDIEMKFVRRIISNPSYSILDAYPIYYISIRNKTDRTIYIDKGNCFRLYNNGKYYIYYNDSEQTTVNDGRSSGVSVGIGSIAGVLGIGGAIGELANGVNIGGGSSYSVSTTYSSTRIIAVPPHANVNLTEEKWIKTRKGSLINDSKYKQIEAAETFERIESEIKIKRGLVKFGESLVYNEINSPWKREYIITYSHDSNFSVHSTMRTELYLHQIIGCSSNFNFNYDKYGYYIKDFDENTIVTCFIMD